ncbi:hypothetical protein [Pontibacter akesuensis]|uniref:Uncharacterized protein n=1 Tax=Pontibacter akesuensis TaxID=388950 RepID=A0A1I7JY67_9BACT|nr:hypothetical protein [Pontibacter akesuensis]GHA76673.1 hypothetical protein GCM10007389_33330 [Pontibacter akesuensis]SFU90045.1 hypothetical protein SAMN04487941_3169 [Pontibacter akesuensis]
MDKWYELDERWTAIGVEDREDYVRHYVVEGRFHASVHEDVVKAYQTAEHLMALAWYHYPVYDEALKKLLGILEMAVKLRCQDIGIPLEEINKKGRRYSFRLEELMDKLCEQEPEKDLKWQLHHGRKLRNNFAHPDRHSFMGGLFVLPFIPLINTLNLLFLETAVVVAAKEHLAYLQQRFAKYQEGLFVLEREDKRYLITKAIPHHTHETSEGWISFWSFAPVLLNGFESLSKHSYSRPLLLTLTNLENIGSAFVGVDLETGAQVRIIPTNHPCNLEMLAQHKTDLNRLDEIDRMLYGRYVEDEVAKKLSRFKYKYCWC